VNEKFPEISHFAVGGLMSIYPLAFLVTAPLIGGHMQKIGRKNTVLIGVITMTIGTLLFALGGYCDEALSFYIVSLFARILQGVADAIISVTIPSIIAIEWPEHQALYLGYNTMANGMGCSMGPLIGSVIYMYVSYVNTFYFFALYIFVLGLGSVLLIP
jgi:MFS family permease